MERKTSRKLSVDAHRKLSAISNCSDVSAISHRLGMDPDDFKSTINSILELDVGEDWAQDSDDGLSCYGDEDGFEDLDKDETIITVQVDKRKFSTVSQASVDSLDACESFEPVQVDLTTVRSALKMYNHHRKISESRIARKK